MTPEQLKAHRKQLRARAKAKKRLQGTGLESAQLIETNTESQFIRDAELDVALTANAASELIETENTQNDIAEVDLTTSKPRKVIDQANSDD